MSVYLTPIQGVHDFPKSGVWPFCQYSQLMADDITELQSFARSMGIGRYPWLTLVCRIPVYYLNLSQRTKAVNLGAKELDVKGVHEFVHRYRLRIDTKL